MFDNEEPAVGEKIYLQARSHKTPKLRGQVAKSSSVVAVEKIKKTETVFERQIAKPERIIEKEVEPKKVSIVKKADAVNKIDFSEQQKNIPKVQKKDAIVGIKKEKKVVEKIEPQKKEVTKVVEVKKDARIIPRKVKVTETKPTTQTSTMITSQATGSPVLDLEKAKRVEQLMGDGSKEIEKIYRENKEALKVQKVIHAPLTNNKTLKVEKARKTLEKRQAAEKKYDQKDVSEDVKNLKKKFDKLIKED